MFSLSVAMFSPVIVLDIQFMSLAFGVALCGLLCIEYYRFDELKLCDKHCFMFVYCFRYVGIRFFCSFYGIKDEITAYFTPFLDDRCADRCCLDSL
jgi:hypothetical protein